MQFLMGVRSYCCSSVIYYLVSIVKGTGRISELLIKLDHHLAEAFAFVLDNTERFGVGTCQCAECRIKALSKAVSFTEFS